MEKIKNETWELYIINNNNSNNNQKDYLKL